MVLQAPSGGREIAQALVDAGVIVVLHEGPDLLLEIARKEVVLEQDPVLQRLVPALDFALRLRVPGRAPDVGHALVLQPVREVAGDVARAVVAQEPRTAPPRGWFYHRR